jgi:hypothetical protein
MSSETTKSAAMVRYEYAAAEIINRAERREITAAEALLQVLSELTVAVPGLTEKESEWALESANRLLDTGRVEIAQRLWPI